MKSARMRAIAKAILSLLLGLFLFILIIRRVDGQKLAGALSQTSIPLIVVAGGFLCLFYFLRAVRWSLILGRRVSCSKLFLYSSLGYLFSSVLPLQAGELIKPELLRVKHGIPYFEGLSSVGMERVLDVVVLVALGLVSLLGISSSILAGQQFFAMFKIVALISIAAFLALVLIALKSSTFILSVSGFLRKVPMLRPLEEKIARFLGTVLDGVSAVRSPALFFGILAVSFLLWIFNFLSVVVIFQALHCDFSLVSSLFGFVVVSAGLSIPLSPGYIGQYEALWVVVFLQLGAHPESKVVAIGILSHGVILTTIACFGILSLVFVPLLSLRDIFGGRFSMKRK